MPDLLPIIIQEESGLPLDRYEQLGIFLRRLLLINYKFRGVSWAQLQLTGMFLIVYGPGTSGTTSKQTCVDAPTDTYRVL